MILDMGSSSLISVALLFRMLFIGGLDSSAATVLRLPSPPTGKSSNRAGPFDVTECNLCFNALRRSAFRFSSTFRWMYAVAMKPVASCSALLANNKRRS